MAYLYQCVECSEKEEPAFNWMTEGEAKAHLKRSGEEHRIFIKAETAEFEIKVVEYEP